MRMLARDQSFQPARLRKTVIEMAYAGSTVHIGCAFSIIEILAVLYRNFLRYPDNDPRSPLRDYMVLSKGHGVMAQYACMRELGWLDESKHISGYFSNGSELKGLSDSRFPGLEVTSGSLGHGFSVGVGLAMGIKRLNTDQKVYVLVGDGELNEGPIWEGMLVAAHHNLDNFMVIVDKNGFQAMGTTEDVLALGNLNAKFDSFGFDVIEIDGHDEGEIDSAVKSLWHNTSRKPKAIIANTVKGKGVSFMESDNRWHYTRLDKHSFDNAIAELSKSEVMQ